jgi:type IV pilus assembly protein PilX
MSRLSQLMSAQPSRQRGAVLAVSLALLLALTLLALATSRATRSQTDFAAAVRERDVAFQAAEAALRAGERLLRSTDPAPCSLERCQIYGPDQLERGLPLQSPEWRQRHAWAYAAGNEWIPWSAGVERDHPAHEAAAFVIERSSDASDPIEASTAGSASPLVTYRITAAGFTRSGRPAVILQSTFAQATETAVADDATVVAGGGTSLGRQSWRQLR